MTFTQNNTSLYRESTEKVHKKMAGVSHFTFWCRECDKERPVVGRKSRGHKMGFRCAECASK